MTSAPSTLAWQLRRAADVAQRVRAGAALPDALADTTGTLAADVRGAVQDLAYRTMRRRGTADHLLRTLAPRAPDEKVRELLVVALALASEPAPVYAVHTLVDQAVEAAPRPKRGFVNAVLRRCLREHDALLEASSSDRVARYNYPAWWIDRVQRDHPAQWEALLETGNRQPPMTLRVNRRRTNCGELLDRFARAGIEARSLAGYPDALRLDRARPVTALPGFAEGWWSVQDAGAQLAAPLLDAHAGMRVLDACAAPGGKTTHILESADCELVALDVDGRRIARVRENLERLGLNAELKVGDAANPDAWWDGRAFDRILADVPCSASGIVRRHPDIRWLRRPGDVDRLATTAAEIVDALWRLLKPDGTMLFATCSIFMREGESQVRNFLARHPDADRLAAPGQLLPTDTDALDHDGFFYARVAKRSAH